MRKALDSPARGVIVKSAEIDFIHVVDYEELIHLHLHHIAIGVVRMQTYATVNTQATAKLSYYR